METVAIYGGLFLLRLLLSHASALAIGNGAGRTLLADWAPWAVIAIASVGNVAGSSVAVSRICTIASGFRGVRSVCSARRLGIYTMASGLCC